MQENQQANDHFVLFELVGTTYGLHSSDVKHMEMIEHITPVPNASRVVEGVIFIRGELVPVINLRIRFGFERIPYDIRTRVIVVKTQNRTVGLLVDTAREFIPIPQNSIHPPPEALAELSGKYLEGMARVGERVVLIINLDEVLSISDLTQQFGETRESEAVTATQTVLG